MKTLDLAEVKKRLQVRAALAVTIESGRIAVDLVRQRGAREPRRALVCAAGGRGCGARRSGKMGPGTGRAAAAAGIREKRCVVCIPAGWALTTATDVPAIDAEDLRGYLELRAEREFPVAADRTAPRALRLQTAGRHTARDARRRAGEARRCGRTHSRRPRAAARSRFRSGSMAACRATICRRRCTFWRTATTSISSSPRAAASRQCARCPGATGGDAANFDAAGFSREVRITLGRLPDALRQQVSEARFAVRRRQPRRFACEIRKHLHRMGIESRVHRPNGAAPGTHPGAALEAAEHHLRRQPVAFEFLAPQVNRWQAFQRSSTTGAGAGLPARSSRRWCCRSSLSSSARASRAASTAEWNGMRRNGRGTRIAAATDPAVPPVVRAGAAKSADPRKPRRGVSRPGRRVGEERAGSRRQQGDLHRLRPQPVRAARLARPVARAHGCLRGAGAAGARRESDPVFHHLQMGDARCKISAAKLS